MNIRSAVERIVQTLTYADRNIEKGELIARLLEIDLRQAKDLEAHGYVQPEDKEDWHSWVLTLDDGSMHSLQTVRRAGPAKTAFVKAVEDYLLGETPLKQDYKVEPLPHLVRMVLAHDGLVPMACEQIGMLTGRFALTIHGKHHGADCWQKKWTNIKIYASKSPEVFVSKDAVTVRMSMPDTVKTGTEGWMLREVIDHPAFEGYRIRLVTARDAGMTLKVERTGK